MFSNCLESGQSHFLDCFSPSCWDRLLGSGTQQAPAQHASSEVRSLGVLQTEICDAGLRLVYWDVTGSHSKPLHSPLGCPQVPSASLGCFKLSFNGSLAH